jgi:hypothetical protein
MSAPVGAAHQDAGRGDLAGSNFFGLAFRDIITPGINSDDTQVRSFMTNNFRF